MGQVVKAQVNGSALGTAFECGYDSGKYQILFQVEGCKITYCKTFIKNVIRALSRNASYVLWIFPP